MKTIVGLLRPTQGEVFIEGISVLRDPVRAKRLLFFVPDSPSPFSSMTGLEYIRFVASAYGLPPRERQARVVSYLRELKLENDLPRRVSGYSRGMKQKLVLVAAFMVRPRLLMLDEPVSGLDTLAIARLKSFLREHIEAGRSVLLSTHLMFLAEQLCDRLVILSRGKLVTSGTMTAIRARSGDEQATLEEIFLEMTDDGRQV